jgi:phage baseplate assembly protein W
MKAKYVYSDFDSHLIIDDNGNVKVLYDEDVIIQSIRHIMATVSGERVRNDIGGSLIRLLFQPIDDELTEDIRDILIDYITKYEDRVIIESISVDPLYDLNAYNIQMRFYIRELNKNVSYQTALRSFS